MYKPPYLDKAFLQQKYATEGLSAAQIASQISSSKTAVLKHLREFGISVRAAHKPHGCPAQPRYGQKVRSGKIGPHLAEQRVIRAVLDLNAEKLSLRQIARFLDSIGVPTKCRGKKWHPEMVARIMAAHQTKVSATSHQAPENQQVPENYSA